MESFINKIYNISIDRFLFNIPLLDYFAVQEDGITVLPQESFFDQDEEIFINQHLSFFQVKQMIPNLPEVKNKGSFHKHDFYEMIYVYQGKVTNLSLIHIFVNRLSCQSAVC